MRTQLNVTLLKAVLQTHELVASMEKQESREHFDSHGMDAAMAEVKLRKDLRWKQNQVSACINLFRILPVGML